MLPQPNSDGEPCILSPLAFFDELGHLHDADVTDIQWNLPHREITIAIDDLYSNFLNLPEYDRLQPVRFILSGVSKAQIDIATDSPPLRIRSFAVRAQDPLIHIVVTFEHDGGVQIDCDSIVCRPNTARR